MKPGVSQKPFSGKPLRRSELRNLNLVESVYPAGLLQPKHTHDLPYFSLVLKGGYTEKCGLKSLMLEPSTLIFHPREEEHEVVYHSSVRIFRFEMAPRFTERLGECSKLLGARAEFRGDSSISLAARLYKEFQRMDMVSPIVIEGLALEIIGEVLRREMHNVESSTPLWLSRAKEILHEQFSEYLSLACIAEAVGVHPVYLARQFRKHYNCTVGEYGRRLRVEAACRKVAESDKPLAEIATEAGFYDQSHFSHTFKRLTGLTPAQFRTTFRAG